VEGVLVDSSVILDVFLDDPAGGTGFLSTGSVREEALDSVYRMD